MFDISALSEFSRAHCITICAVLVPLNLLATLQTMLGAWFGRPLDSIQVKAAIACFLALILILHVISWLEIGVIMAPTFILSFLGSLCIVINLSCVAIAARKRHPLIRAN